MLLAGSAPLAAWMLDDLIGQGVSDLDLWVDNRDVVPYNWSTQLFVDQLYKYFAIASAPHDESVTVALSKEDIFLACQAIAPLTFIASDVDPFIFSIAPCLPPPHGLHPFERYLFSSFYGEIIECSSTHYCFSVARPQSEYWGVFESIACTLHHSSLETLDTEPVKSTLNTSTIKRCCHFDFCHRPITEGDVQSPAFGTLVTAFETTTGNAAVGATPSSVTTATISKVAATTFHIGGVKLSIIRIDPTLSHSTEMHLAWPTRSGFPATAAAADADESLAPSPMTLPQPIVTPCECQTVFDWIRHHFDITCCADVIFNGRYFYVRNAPLLERRQTFLPPFVASDLTTTIPEDIRVTAIMANSEVGSTPAVASLQRTALARRVDGKRILKYIQRGWIFVDAKLSWQPLSILAAIKYIYNGAWRRIIKERKTFGHVTNTDDISFCIRQQDLVDDQHIPISMLGLFSIFIPTRYRRQGIAHYIVSLLEDVASQEEGIVGVFIGPLTTPDAQYLERVGEARGFTLPMFYSMQKYF